MPLKTPDEPKVYTTKYSDFRGVDISNDQSNVFYRRSPNALNMMPDEAGRPVKRHGWETELSEEDFKIAYDYEGDIIIVRCYYFTIGGVDHILIFTNVAIFLYTNELTVLTDEEDCVDSHERAFFFDSDGMAGFYIYGGFKLWRYIYDSGEFLFEVIEPHIPLIFAGNSPAGLDGKQLEAYNMLGNLCKEQFYHNAYSATVSGAPETLTISVDSAKFAKKVEHIGQTTFKYTTAWDKTLDDYGIEVTGDPVNGNSFTVTLVLRVYLAKNVSQQQISDIEVKGSKTTQFDTILTVMDESGTLSTGKCMLVSGETDFDRAYIAFYDYFEYMDGTEDAIQILHPSLAVISTDHNIKGEATALLSGRKK